MTNYELLRWLVEMPSRDVEHYHIYTASWSPEVDLSWPRLCNKSKIEGCIHTSFIGVLTCGCSRRLLASWATLTTINMKQSCNCTENCSGIRWELVFLYNHLYCCLFRNLSFLSVFVYGFLLLKLPSVLWCCWLGSRKGILPVKKWVVGFWHGYLSEARCRLTYSPGDAIAARCLLLQ